MSRKLKKGYFVRGKFVAEGSELDIELKAELKGTTESSKSDLKKEMDDLQLLGKQPARPFTLGVSSLPSTPVKK